jgi:hypothetical protein
MVAPVKDTDGLLYSDTSAKAEILNNQFHSVYTKEDFDNLPSQRRILPLLLTCMLGIVG